MTKGRRFQRRPSFIIIIRGFLPEHRVQGRQYPADHQGADRKTLRGLEQLWLHDQTLILDTSPILDKIDDRHTDDTEDKYETHPIHERDLIDALVLIVRRIEPERGQPV